MQMNTLSHDSLLSGELNLYSPEEERLMGGIIIVDLYLQRINQEAQRRGHWAATTGARAGVGSVRGAREIRLNSRRGFTKPEVR